MFVERPSKMQKAENERERTGTSYERSNITNRALKLMIVIWPRFDWLLIRSLLTNSPPAGDNCAANYRRGWRTMEKSARAGKKSACWKRSRRIGNNGSFNYSGFIRFLGDASKRLGWKFDGGKCAFCRWCIREKVGVVMRALWRENGSVVACLFK